MCGMVLGTILEERESNSLLSVIIVAGDLWLFTVYLMQSIIGQTDKHNVHPVQSSLT